jgi:hypothetical protein
VTDWYPNRAGRRRSISNQADRDTPSVWHRVKLDVGTHRAVIAHGPSRYTEIMPVDTALSTVALQPGPHEEGAVQPVAVAEGAGYAVVGQVLCAGMPVPVEWAADRRIRRKPRSAGRRRRGSLEER